MSQVKLTSIDRVISGLYRDLKPAIEINESDMIEWAGEALEHIGAYSQWDERVEYIKISDYRALIPCGMHKIIQVAYKFTDKTPTETATLTTCDSSEETCTNPACTSCDTATCGDDLCSKTSQLISNAELFLEYYKPTSIRYSQYYNSNFKPLRLATSPYSKAASMHCSNCVNLTANCEQEYTIDHPYIRTDFKEGYICLSYLGQALDEQGYPMIPDEVSYVEAIKRYIVYKVKYSEFIQGVINPQVFAKLEDDWHWYCRQARGKANMPDTVDKLENLLQQRQRLIPKINRYYGFFGNLASKEALNLGNNAR